MAVHFGMFAELERQLRDALNAPDEAVPELTKTQRRKLAKQGRAFQKAKPIARPDKTTIRLNCLPLSGPAEIHEFSYYTPFQQIAMEKALRELSKNGKVYQWITVLENEKHT